MPASEPSHYQLARDFMALRGYGDVEPAQVDRVGEEYIWYFDYHLAEGDLTLEVAWTEDAGWIVSVWDFHLRG